MNRAREEDKEATAKRKNLLKRFGDFKDRLKGNVRRFSLKPLLNIWVQKLQLRSRGGGTFCPMVV